MLITEEYRQLNQKLHEDPHYGTSARAWSTRVKDLCQAYRTHEVLDYGCGKRYLERDLGWDITNYDPAIPGLDQSPEPHDIVACIDVLEHIEPRCLEDVLADLQRVIKKAGFFLIANRPAKKVLPDGRNAHLIQKGPDWWLPLIMSRWYLSMYHEVMHDDHPVGFVVVVRAP